VLSELLLFTSSAFGIEPLFDHGPRGLLLSPDLRTNHGLSDHPNQAFDARLLVVELRTISFSFDEDFIIVGQPLAGELAQAVLCPPIQTSNGGNRNSQLSAGAQFVHGLSAWPAGSRKRETQLRPRDGHACGKFKFVAGDRQWSTRFHVRLFHPSMRLRSIHDRLSSRTQRLEPQLMKHISSSVFPPTFLLCASAAFGQVQEAATQPIASHNQSSSSEYVFTFTPGLWVPRLGGENGPDILVEEAFDLDNSESVFNLEVAMRKNDYWQIDLSGFDFETSQSGQFSGNADFAGLELNEGDPFDASFGITSAAIELSWWQWDVCRIGHYHGEKPCRVDLRFAPLLGMRYIDVEQTIDLPGEGRVETGGEWLAAFAGMNLQMRYDTHDSFPLIDFLEIDGSLAIGPTFGGDGGAMAQIRTGVTAFFNQNVGFTFGYRLLQVDVENDPYEFQGGLQGLFFAGTIRF
jgi:hypothetical protein